MTIAPSPPIQEPEHLMVGAHPSMVELRDAVSRAAGAAAPVVIQGRTGTGKELVAKLLHQSSGRPGRLVPLNLAELAPELVEAELFGVLRGAYTGATAGRPGLIEAARDGTLFIDEAVELPPALQVKLLRTLETGIVRRVGADEGRLVPFRLVVSVQQPVGQLVTSGQWRSDFAYRVAGIILKVPPLRERISDIGPLSQRFLAELGCAPLSIEALGVLERHDWPGNVRELRRVLERAALRSVCGSVTPDQLIAAIDAAFEPGPDEDGDVLTSGDRPTLAELERKYLRQVLREAEFDVRESARVLGMPASTLYRRLRAMGIGLRPVPDYQK